MPLAFFGVPGYNPDPQTGDNGPGWGWLALLLPFAEQSPLYNAINVNLPTWVADNGTVVLVQINVYNCPSANNPSTPVSMVDANVNLLPVANQYFARSDYVYNVGWNDSGMPATVNYDDIVTGCSGPIYRNSHITYAGVTDGLSNTVFAGERTPYLTDAYLGERIIPGYRHFAWQCLRQPGHGAAWESTTTMPTPSSQPTAVPRSMRIRSLSIPRTARWATPTRCTLSIPVGATSCWAMARSGSSSRRSTC